MLCEMYDHSRLLLVLLLLQDILYKLYSLFSQCTSIKLLFYCNIDKLLYEKFSSIRLRIGMNSVILFLAQLGIIKLLLIISCFMLLFIHVRGCNDVNSDTSSFVMFRLNIVSFFNVFDFITKLVYIFFRFMSNND